MKINLVAVGTKMPNWVTQGYEEYSKRLSKDCQLNLLEISAAKRGKTAQPQQWKQEEGQRILAAIPDNHHVIALEVEGKAWNTNQLAAQMEGWMQNGRDISLMIGGPDGLDSSCLTRANQKWSLSALTLPHPIVRIVLAEQLYRAWTVIQNHPYHRA